MHIRKHFYSLCGALLISTTALQAQTSVLNKEQVEEQLSAFKKMTDFKQKKAVYDLLATQPALLNSPYAELKVASMQYDFAVEGARQNNMDIFKIWIDKIGASVMRNKAISEGYAELMKHRSVAESTSLIQLPLDSLQKKQPWNTNDANLYAMLLHHYLKVADDRAKPGDLVIYMQPWFDAEGGFFGEDLSNKVSDESLLKSLTFRFASALARTGQRDKAFKVLAKAVEVEILSLAQIDILQNHFSEINNLNAQLSSYLKKTALEYPNKVKQLLKKNTLSGHPHDVNELHGKYIVLDFWGSWCIPCRASHPKMIALYNIYKEQGLEFISVAKEAPAAMEVMESNWKKAIAFDKMEWPQILDNQGIEYFNAVQEFGIGVFPTKILLDKNWNKIEIFQGSGGTDALAKKLEELLPSKDSKI